MRVVVDFEIVFRVAKPADLVFDLTEITHHFAAKGHGLFRTAEPVLSAIIRRERQKTCAAVKQAIEKL